MFLVTSPIPPIGSIFNLSSIKIFLSIRVNDVSRALSGHIIKDDLKIRNREFSIVVKTVLYFLLSNAQSQLFHRPKVMPLCEQSPQCSVLANGFQHHIRAAEQWLTTMIHQSSVHVQVTLPVLKLLVVSTV